MKVDQSNLARRRKVALHEKSNASYHEKHQEVVAAAAEIFLQNGYENTKLKDISDALGMDRATLYYYASSKKSLFDEVLKNASEKNIHYIESLVSEPLTSQEKLSLAVEALMDSYSRDYPYLAIFMQQYLQSSPAKDQTIARESGAWGRRYYNALRSIIQQGLDNGDFAFSLPVGVATNAVIGTVNWIHLARGPNAGKSDRGDRAELSDAHLTHEVSRFIVKALSD